MRCAIAFILAAAAATATGLSCQDDNGNPVDWFALIKINNSFDYAYMDARTPEFHPSSHNLADKTTGALAHTLSPLYGGTTNSYVFYNDEKPDGSKTSSHAHAKGVVGVSDSLDGFWLVHSTPKTPVAPSSTNSFPGLDQQEIIYAQSFLCISISGATALNTIGEALYLDWPWVYDESISATVAKASPALAQVAAGNHPSDATCNPATLQSAGGQSFTVFSKSANWGKELYADCVAPGLQTDELLVESWIRGSACPPSCGANKVLDVANVTVAGWAWQETQDHSKWAVTDSGNTGCIGDINRMTSQSKRGGGTVCASVLGQPLRAAVVGLSDSCSSSPSLHALRGA